MRVRITSSYDKKVYYRIYAADGKKRALLTKGIFIGSTEFELPHTGREIIVRIKPKRGIKSVPSFFKTIIINFNHFLEKVPATPNKEEDNYNIFDEIRITDCSRAEEMVINYNLPPVSETACKIFHGPYREYITCKTHPYKIEESSKNRASDIFDIISIFIILALIFGIALLVGFLVRSC